MPNRVLVIGLDGVPYDLIKSWTKEGNLPVIGGLMSEGAAGKLRSTIPPTSGPSWSSFITGKNPGKTGIFDFLYRRKDSYIFPAVNASHRDGKSLWRLLSEEGKGVGVLNVPMTYPVEEVNGFMISGWMTPFTARDYIYPPQLAHELRGEVGNYRIYPMETFSPARKDSFMQACYQLLDMRTRTALYLMERYEWDLLMMVLFDTDRVLHQLWHYLDPHHPWHRGQSWKPEDGEFVLRYFQKVDETIGKLLDQVDDDTTVILMSDHGMGAAHKFVILNNWLLRVGLLKLKGDLSTKIKASLFHSGFTLTNIHRLADRLGVAKHAEYKGLYFLDSVMKPIFLSFADVDWARSRAYSYGRHFGNVYINLKGREPQGIVEPGEEYDALREEIAQTLADFTDPATGQPIVGQVLKKEEIYAGPHLDQAPDLILIPQNPNHIFFGLSDFGSDALLQTTYRYSGMHRNYGLFAMKGQEIERGAAIEGAKIEDLAPTILHLLGVAIPQDMDGKVLTGALTQESLGQRPIVWRREGHPPLDRQGPSPYTENEEREIKERLRKLGYFS